MNRLEKRKVFEREFIDKGQQLHNFKYDYSKVQYINSRTKVTIICLKHGEFEQLPSSHLQGNGCPMCAKEWTDEHKQNHIASARLSRGMTTDEWILRAKEVHGDKYDYSQTEYVNQRTAVKIICPIHGLFEQKADSHLRGCGCAKCGNASENHFGVHNWTDEQRLKHNATMQERYGASRYLDSDEGREKMQQIRSNPEFRKKMHDVISSAEVQEKTRQTSLSRYGVSSPMKLAPICDKAAETKRINGTWSTSKPEENMYTLFCSKFGADDVVRQYKSVAYPFRCDFYIKSLDLYIELNATWLHGGHWFDACDADDIAVLHKWRDAVLSGHKFYTVAIDVWTVRDVKKRETALNNQLNYLVFWDNKLSDFMEWLTADELVLNNISN